MNSDSTGEISPLLKIKEQFNLSTVYHYDCDFSPPDLSNIPRIFKDDSAVQPKSSLKWTDNSIASNLTLVRDDHYIDCRIDLNPNISLQEIKDQVASFVKLARTEILRKNNRQQFASNEVAYQVYDLRLNRVPFSDISRKLGINAASARQKFRRAWQLIRGEEYHPEQLPNLIQQYFAEQGQWNRFQELDSPRQEVLAYADKDGRLPVIDQHTGNSISAMKELCRGCGDTECSSIMFNIFDMLGEEGIPKLGNCIPCPDLINLLRDLKYSKARKSRTLPGAE